MPNTKPFPFPRLRFRLLSFFHRRPARLTYQETQGYNNTQSAARSSGTLHNAPTAMPAGADVWIHPQLPTVAELSPVRPIEPFIQQKATIQQARLDMRRQNTSLAHSVRMSQVARNAQSERTLTLHELPAMPRALRAFIDAQSNETPPEQPAWNCFVVPGEEDEDATEQMTALQKLARKRV